MTGRLLTALAAAAVALAAAPSAWCGQAPAAERRPSPDGAETARTAPPAGEGSSAKPGHGYLFTMENPGPRARVGRAWGASEGMALVEAGGKWGFIDTHGEVVIRPQYDWASDFFEGLAWVQVGQKCGYIDRRGEMVIEPRFERASCFRDGLAWVKTGGRWGCIDREGRLVIPAVFADVASFSEGLAAVKIGGRWGYVSRRGRMVIHPRFDHAWSFTGGLARVELGGSWGYVNAKGKTVWSGGRSDVPVVIVLRRMKATEKAEPAEE